MNEAPKTVFYVLVENATGGLALHEFLKAAGCCARIAPAPRGQQTCCGMALLVMPPDIEPVLETLALPDAPAHERVVELPYNFNPNRDKYC